ncbi:MAG: hypothetical protein GEU95_01005 [Rhizobiales bacterium]|nr:hypothetical protein [Hyphomicrobiales bacterium]
MILKVEDLRDRKATDYMHMRGQGFSLISHGVEGEPRLTVSKYTNKKERTTTVTWAVDGQPVVDLRAALDVINGEKRIEDVLKPKENKWKGVYALSIRQPWAWAIFNLGKDIENRDWKDTNPNLGFRGDFLIHVSASKTKEDRHDYDELLKLCTYSPDVPKGMIDRIPPFGKLERGGILGAARVVDIVTNHPSKWACLGCNHLVIERVRMCPTGLIPCRGQLGFFKPPADVLAALPRTKAEPENLVQAG